MKTQACDRTGVPYYAPEQPQKALRPQGKEEYVYTDYLSNPLIKITVVRPGKIKDKDVYQQYWSGVCWVKAKDFPQDKKREYQQKITWYRYADVKDAIAQGKSIFIVEGEGICETLWKLGIAATTTIGGGGKYRAYGNCPSDLEGASVVLCPDRDEPGLKHMEEIFKDFPRAKWMYAPPNDFYWQRLPKSGGLDVKDWIEDGATVEDIMQAIGEHRTFSNTDDDKPEASIEDSKSPKSRHRYNKNLIQDRWGDRLRWNELKKYVELDGKRLLMDCIKTDIADNFDIDISREDAKEIVLKIAKENSYNPVVEYLEAVTAMHPDVDTLILDAIAPKYLGTDDPLHVAIMRRTMIAAVARAFDPGCKHDNIAILQGSQGSLKSTFWSVLASKQLFTDDIVSRNEKDEVLKLSQYWIMEYAEFETAYRDKEVSQLKAFFAREFDSIRRPYGCDIEDVMRPSIFVGSTNKSEFLKDPTGERRYWVVPVRVKKINIPELRKERDLLWAAAVLAYRSGEQWHLTDAEEDMLCAANGQYQQSDSWESAIASYLHNRPYVVVGNILSDVLKLELAFQDRKSEMRVADVLRRLGWQKAPKQRRINGQTRWVWEPMNSYQEQIKTVTDTEVVMAANADIVGDLVHNSNCHNLSGYDKVMTEVVTPSNVDAVNISAIASQPSQPLSETLVEDELAIESSSYTKKEEFLDTQVVTVAIMTETPSIQAIEAVITPVITPVTTYSPSPDDQEVVQGNVELLLEAISERSQEMILTLTESWSAKFKQAVWSVLSLGDKLVIKTLLANNTVSSLSLSFEC